MFSGQGSHYFQMGKDLMNENLVFTHWMNEGDEILMSLGETSLLEKIYTSPQSDIWRDLLSTHPGLVIIQYAMFQTLKTLGMEADAVLGSSLGVFAAAAASEVLSFEEAVKTAYHQARLIIEHCPLGGILAVLASPDVYWCSKELQALVAIGGVNFQKHFLLSGTKICLEQSKMVLQSLNINYQELAVDYPFHSLYINAAKKSFETYFKDHIQTLRRPIIPWVTEKETIGISELHELQLSDFWDAVAQPMNFQKTIQTMELQGDMLYVDVGPSGTLSTFVKYNLTEKSNSRSFQILTPFHQGKQKILDLLGHLVASL